MFRNGLLLAVLLFGCGVIPLHQASAGPRSQDTLRSFYIARFYSSDAIWDYPDQILDVTPEGDNVRVRVILVSRLYLVCPGLIVRATERVFQHTSVRKIAGRDICAFTSKQVDDAMKATAIPEGEMVFIDSASQTIVAECGTKEKVFDFPHPEEVERKVLKRLSPQVSGLWDTGYRIHRRAFGKNFDFDEASPAQEKKMEELGTKLVPELISGKYQTAYADSGCGGHDCDNYFAWQLRGYTEAPKPYNPFAITLLNAASLHLVQYVSPIMPPIAGTAHVYGDVRLRIVADPKTGLAESAEFVSGPPLLARAAIAAAQRWQFSPESLSGQPLEATLRFALPCR
jgi:hypothetical protein